MGQKRGKMENNIVLVDLEARRREALDLRIQGYTYEEIANFIKGKYGPDMSWYGRRDAWADVDDLLKEARKDTRERASELLEIELARLDKMMSIAWEAVQEGSLRAMDTVLKIMTRRASMLGLDVPIKNNTLGNWKEEIIGLLKSGKVTQEQIEREFGKDILDDLLVSQPIRQLPDVVDAEVKK